MESKIRDLMRHRPPSVREGTRIAEAVHLLLNDGVAEIYVTDEVGRLKGVVPEYEFLKAQLADLSDNDGIESLMSPNFAVVEPDCEVARVAALFRDRRHARIAVAKDGILVGQVSTRDVLRLMLEEKKQPADPSSDATEARPPRSHPAPSPRRPSREPAIVR